ncbi:MAG: sensor histidine kinase, partial [archaeon]|nr:sensor histidine kinase [archaeon]
EVHHRVKNNLQLITSFINLEKRFQSDSDEIIDITKKRIDALAAIHERIYAEENMKNIHMKSFSADFIKNLYALSDHTGINFITDTSDDILFSIDIITPIILIYNELVTNSLKHAFDKDFNGIKEIHSKLEFKTIDSKLYCQFTYRDTGKGLPEGFDINKVNSLGMIIIKELSGQLDGEFEFFNDNGFNFKLTFPLKEDLTGYI